jgi:phosphoglycolate phosphatase-like HAD superfamily hydrolase
MRPTVFVDVDNTLVCTRPLEYANCVRESGLRSYHVARMSDETLQSSVCGPSDKVVRSRRGTYVSRLRPGAAEMLSELKGLGLKVFALSNGMSDFVQRVMAAHGFDKVLDGMYGRDTFCDTEKVGRNFLLIDDRDIDDIITFQKLYALGAVRSTSDARLAENCLVIVPPYDGDKEDDGLADVVERVKRKIA